METRAHPGEATAHACAVLDAFIYGFALQEAMLEAVELPDDSPGLVEHMDLCRFPRVAEMAQMYATAPDYRFTASFDVGLNRLLDGVERFAEAFPEP